VHNLINLRLGKEEFDCLTLDATYDCGCGDEAVVTGLGKNVSEGIGGQSLMRAESGELDNREGTPLGSGGQEKGLLGEMYEVGD